MRPFGGDYVPSRPLPSVSARYIIPSLLLALLSLTGTTFAQKFTRCHRATALACCASFTSRHTSLSRRRSCASTPQLPARVFRLASSCFSGPIICASVQLLLDIPSSPSVRSNHTQLCAESGDQVTAAMFCELPLQVPLRVNLK